MKVQIMIFATQRARALSFLHFLQRKVKNKNNAIKLFKTQVEPRAAGGWFHYQVLNILWRHF